ncbi:ABC transporter ATP-binding protein [Caldisalinibacter kiritimatiensis]|uniref:Hydroxymethylpyrimidine ABC transporter, ATPase component n=1 Tax=Caldisalinibacter kiritimatiensis TaxID=1304284 RepID=R1CRB7_9FIRM|nr:ABC transporter ATP-binding protein [Caldisalinibacter kiritimatiensis]EOD01226.1 Hydroxymethylpyrimidine ABC transporter, ATPase component [Caldisalinibacter kiritimatiensis]
MVSEKEQEVLIDIQNLKFEYGTNVNKILALDNINLQLRKGEFLCVLGPSGCGKSTLLKLIAGYMKPTSGVCLMEGKPITGPDWNRGVVFQSPTLYPWMNVRENVEFGPKMRGVSSKEIEQITTHFLEQVKLNGFGDKATFELSGGMKQRVALARVLANYPEMILMDEPFGALDALTRGNMQTLIRDIWKENNSTIFLITHDIDEALSLGTRVVVMSKRPGKILKEFNINFTNEIFNNKTKHVMYNQEYFDIKNEILDIINNQTEE